MKGVKIARSHKSLTEARPKDEVMDTSLTSLPIAKKVKFTIIFQAGVQYGYPPFATNAMPSTSFEHGLPYTPLFRGWIDLVNETTGEKTGSKYSLPVVTSGNGFSARADSSKIYIDSFISGVTTTPAAKLVYEGYMYVFGARV